MDGKKVYIKHSVSNSKSSVSVDSIKNIDYFRTVNK